MRTEELANYIEKIRYGRNISQETFLVDIISLRQYQRYRSGQSIMPVEILEKMAVKLSIPVNKLLAEFEVDKHNESKKVTEFYNSVVSKRLNQANTIRKDFVDYVFIDDEKELLFSSANILCTLYEKKLSPIEMVKLQANLIDYPDILKNNIMTDAELLILGIIMEYSPTEQDRIIVKLSNFLDKTDLLVTENNIFPYTQVLYWISKYYGKKNEYDKVVRFCELGIELNIKNKTVYLLENFYYYKALVYFRNNNNALFEECLYNCILLLENDSNVDKRGYFYNIILKDLNINPYDFLITLAKRKKTQHFE